MVANWCTANIIHCIWLLKYQHSPARSIRSFWNDSPNPNHNLRWRKQVTSLKFSQILYLPAYPHIPWYMPINHGVVHLLTSFIDHITTILYPIASPYFIMFRWLYKYTMLTFVNKGAGLYSMFTPGNKVHVVREMHQNRCGGFLAEKRVAQLISRHGFVLLIAFFLLVFQSFQPETLPAAHKKNYHSMSV